MNESWKEYSKYVARVTGQSINQVSSSIKLLMQSANCNNIGEAFRSLSVSDSDELVERKKGMTGNKRNGTQDRRQAFGNLF